MKLQEKITKALAVFLMLCMLLPQTALAATTYYIEVSVSGPDAEGHTQTVRGESSHYGSRETPLATEVVGIINTQYSALAAAFSGTGLRDIVDNGLSAFHSGWQEFVYTYFDDVNGAFKSILSDKTATFNELQPNQANQVTYTDGSRTYTVTVTLRAYTAGSGTSGGSSSSTTTETSRNPDGSTTTTTTDQAAGTVTETTKAPNGVTGTTVTKKNGTITQITATVSAAAVKNAEKNGEAITLPVEVPVVVDRKNAPTVEVKLPPNGGSVKVELPVEKTIPGLVAIIVDDQGNETLVPTSVATDEGVKLELDGSANVKIVDNSKAFEDVSKGHWAGDAVAFVSSHELFQGVNETAFAPDRAMTRGMLATVLYRLESRPGTTVEGAFTDVKADAYYTDGVSWANENGIVTGYGDGSFQPDRVITRQQLAAMLYRYAGSPGVMGGELDYPDAARVSDYAKDAMKWAAHAGIIQGKTNGALEPHGLATRAQVAVMMMRYCNYALDR